MTSVAIGEIHLHHDTVHQSCLSHNSQLRTNVHSTVLYKRVCPLITDMKSFTPALGSHCIRCWVAEEEGTGEGETARQRCGWGSQVLPQAARHAVEAVRCKPDTMWDSLPRRRVWLVACMLCAALFLRAQHLCSMLLHVKSSA